MYTSMHTIVVLQSALLSSIYVHKSCHYENMSVQYEAISKSGKNYIFRCKNVTFFLIFAQKNEAVLTSTHNLCFRAKIRKMNTPVNPSLTI